MIHGIIDDGTGDGVVDWEDAQKWVDGNDGNHTVLDPRIVVLADPDYSMWYRFSQDCTTYPDCACNYTPQIQIIDQGGVTVSDTCAVPPGGTVCTQCGYNDAAVRKVLDSILPAAWCGEATP